jgi:hypothetical protein
MSETKKQSLDFEVDFETKKVMPIHVGRLQLGNAKEASSVRLVLMPDGLHLFFEASKFVHVTDRDQDLYYELRGVHP